LVQNTNSRLLKFIATRPQSGWSQIAKSHVGAPPPPPKVIPTDFDVVVGLAWSKDPESSAGSSVATGRASHARQVKGDDPDKKGYTGPPGWGLGMGLTTQPHKKSVVLRSLQNRKPHTSNFSSKRNLNGIFIAA